MIKRHSHRLKQMGFTLISVSIMLTVIGILAATSLALNNMLKKAEEIERMNDDITTITNKMAHYLSEHQRLPCPARNDLDSLQTGYGVETDCTDLSIGTDDGNDTNDCGGGYCVSFVSSARVRTGIVPFKSLQIELEDARDEYNGMYTYAVTELQASSGVLYTRGGGIVTVDVITFDSAGTMITTPILSDFAVVSHGPDKNGAYTAAGALSSTDCTGVGMDIENCDKDAHFRVQDLFLNPGPNHFDDRVEYNLQDWIYIWDNSFSENADIYSRGFGRMGIGTDAPNVDSVLHVSGGDVLVTDTVLLDSTDYGIVITPKYCDDTGTKCFTPSAIAGALADGEGMSCGGSGEYIDGFESDDTAPQKVRPKCAEFDKVRNVGCPDDAFITSVQYDQASNSFSFVCTDAIDNSASSH